MVFRLSILLLLLASLAAACSPSRVEVAEEALLALEQEGASGLLPYLTRDGRRFLETVDLKGFSPSEGEAPIQCSEDDCPADAGWCWVTCVQGERTLRIAVVDTGRGPRIDMFRWGFEPFSGLEGAAADEVLP